MKKIIKVGILWIILMLFAILRLVNINHITADWSEHANTEAYIDDAYTYNVSILPVTQLVTQTIQQDVHMPTWYLILHFVGLGLGNDMTIFRLVSFFFALIYTFLVLRLIRDWKFINSALLLAYLAINPFLIQIDTSARMYSLGLCLLLTFLIYFQKKQYNVAYLIFVFSFFINYLLAFALLLIIMQRSKIFLPLMRKYWQSLILILIPLAFGFVQLRWLSSAMKLSSTIHWDRFTMHFVPEKLLIQLFFGLDLTAANTNALLPLIFVAIISAIFIFIVININWIKNLFLRTHLIYIILLIILASISLMSPYYLSAKHLYFTWFLALFAISKPKGSEFHD